MPTIKDALDIIGKRQPCGRLLRMYRSLLEGSKKTMETQLLIRSKGYPTLYRFQEWQKVL